MEEKKVLLSVKDLYVKFRVRGRVLTAIRGVSLDIYENESIAIVGESGCGKSVLTKTFAGMLDNNGFIDHGGIYFHDEEVAARMISGFEKRLNEDSKLELGSATYREILALEKERKERLTLSEEAAASFDAERKELAFRRAEVYNFKQMLDSSREKEKIREVSRTIAAYDQKLRALEKRQRRRFL